jgi:hypothetical protein
MAKKGNVQLTHNQIGSSRGRRGGSATTEEQDKINDISDKAREVFQSLENDMIADEEEEDLERTGRLADFRELVFLGRIESEVSIAGWDFVINTLTGKEQRSLLSEIMSVDPDKRLIYAKPYTIRMALSSINGTPLDVASASAGYEDSFEFICSWQDPLIERLYSEYDMLSGKSKSIFSEKTIEGDLKK